jgi:SpoVK/Ycf46/Vps4 family AAA+-type ATPase
MPDHASRRELLKLETGFSDSGDYSKKFDDLARDTKGLSGGDIKILVREGFQRRLEKIMDATHFYKVGTRRSAHVFGLIATKG